MDYEQDWAATALFSPSKARQQQAAAKDWSFVDNWLARKYHPKPVPKFERNDDTLQALLALAAFNEKADEEKELVTRLEKAAFEEMEAKTYPPMDNTVFSTIQASLSPTGEDALTAQAESSVFLNSHNPSAETLAHKTLELTTTAFELEQQLSRVTELQTSLEREQTHLSSQLQELRSPAFIASPDLPQKTSEFLLQNKTLMNKLGEYKVRLAAGRGDVAPERAIKDLEMRRAEREELAKRLRGVEQRIAEYEGIPPDAQGARRVLDEARMELREWTERRDRLFEGLVEDGRP